MTSPDYNSPAGAYNQSTLYTLQNASKSAGAAVANGGTLNLLGIIGDTFFGTFLGGFNSVIDLVEGAVNDFLSTLSEVFTGVENGDFNDIGTWINDSLGRDQSLASRVARIEGKIAIGAEFFDDFNRGDSEFSLGNDWTMGGQGMPIGIDDQAAQLSRALLPDDGRRWAKAPAITTGDDATVAAVIHPRGTPPIPGSYLFLRCKSDMTRGVYVALHGNHTYLGWFTRIPTSGDDNWQFHDWADTAKAYSNSATIEFKAQGSRYQVVLDGKIILDYIDSANTAPTGADYRSVGLGMTTYTAFLQLPQYSGGFASFAMRSQVSFTSVTAQAATAATAAATTAVAPIKTAVTAATVANSPVTPPAEADPAVYTGVKLVSDTARTASQQATTTAIALQQQQQNENVGGGNSLNKVFTFNTALTSTDWTPNNGPLYVDGNQLVLNANVANGSYYMRSNYSFTTDDQAVIAQLGTEATVDSYTYLCLRTNFDGTQGLAVRINQNSIAIGTFSFTGQGGSAGFTSVASVGRTQNTGDSVEFRAVGDNYVALVNGSTAATYSGTLGSKGSSWRGASIIKQRTQPFFVTYSFNLYSFGMYDFGQVGSAVSNRTAIRLSRISTADVGFSLGNGQATILPSNFFSQTDFAQGITILDLPTAKVRIDTAGWYQVTLAIGLKMDAENNDIWMPPFWCLYRTPAGSTTATAITPGIPGGVPTPVALAAGDVIQPGIVNYSPGAVFRTGSADAQYGRSDASGLVAIGGQGVYFQVIADM